MKLVKNNPRSICRYRDVISVAADKYDNWFTNNHFKQVQHYIPIASIYKRGGFKGFRTGYLL